MANRYRSRHRFHIDFIWTGKLPHAAIEIWIKNFANRYRAPARCGRIEVAFGAYTAAIATFPDDWIYLRQKTRVVREHIPPTPPSRST